MLSRRTALASIGSGLAVSISGCSSKLAGITESEPDAERNEDGLVFERDFVHQKAKHYKYTVDLAEGEYDYTLFENPAGLRLSLMALPETGSMHAMYIPKTEFEEKYRVSDSLEGYSCVGTPEDEGLALGETEVKQEWVLIVDNTEYIGHSPDGRCTGVLQLAVK